MFTSQYAQLKAIHVSIVNLPKESASELTSISPDDSRIEKITVEVKKTEEIKKKEISKPVTKIEKLKEVKSVKDEMAAISEAVKKRMSLRSRKNQQISVGQA